MASRDQLSIFIMNILAKLAIAGVPVIVKKRFQFIDVVCRQRKMVTLTKLAFGRKTGHLSPVVAVEAVSPHHGGMQPFTGEQSAEDAARGGGARARGTGNRNDRMAF